MKKLKLELTGDTSKLVEIYQRTGMVFSFVTHSEKTSVITQCHKMVKCRDFLHDAARTALTGKQSSIYGFSYSREKDEKTPIDFNVTRMLISKKDLKSSKDVADFSKKMKAAQKLVNHYEKIAGCVETRIVYVEDKDKNPYWYFEGPDMWMKAPFLISMYTFLIRLGIFEMKFKTNKDLLKEYDRIIKEYDSDKDKNGKNDQLYLKDCKTKLHVIAKNYKKLCKDKDLYNEGIEIGRYHNSSGVQSLCRKCSNFKTAENELERMVKDA